MRPPGDRLPRHGRSSEREAGPQHLGHAERAAVLAAGEVGELRRQDGEGRGHGQRHHGKEDGAHAQREQADEQRQRDARHQRDGEARQRRGPGRAPAVEREPDAVAAEAVEHGVGERDDAGVAEQQIVARHQHDEDAHLGRRVDRLRPLEQERRRRQHDQDRQPARAQHPAARQIAGEQSRRSWHRSPVQRTAAIPVEPERSGGREADGGIPVGVAALIRHLPLHLRGERAALRDRAVV